VPPPPSYSHSGNVKEGNSKVEGINNEDSKSSTTSIPTSTSHPDLTEIHVVTSTESAARLIVEHSSYFTHLRVVPNLSCDIRALMVEAQIIENRMINVRAEQKRISYIA
jgi:hypothetical protein